MEIIGRYIVLNNNITEFNKSNCLGNKVYEVLRVINGYPLFIEEHLYRLNNSLNKLDINIKTDLNQTISLIQELSDKNNIREGNVYIEYSAGESINSLIHFIPHHYPNAYDYIKGVNTRTSNIERDNPEVKQTSVKHSINQQIKELINEYNIYEVLLVNNDGCITEGSRTNVFFIKNNSIYTAPKEQVLSGITRQKAIQLCHELSISVNEESIPIGNLENYDAAFLTGTSPKILPVAMVNHFQYNMKLPILQKLINGYDQMISNYIALNTK